MTREGGPSPFAELPTSGILPPMSHRFAIRPDARGFSVYDASTGETVVFANSPQQGLTRQDADHTAAMLNQRQGAEATPYIQKPDR